MKHTKHTPLERLKHHVSGAIERGEATPIEAIVKHTKHTVLILFALLFCWVFSGCASAPPPAGPRQCELPPALREIFRGGELIPLQTADGPALGMPNYYDQVSHTCVSTPIFGLDGRYVRTAVRCW